MKNLIEQQIEFLKKCLEDTADGSWSTHLNKPIQKQIENLTEQLRLYDVVSSFNLEIKDRDIATIEALHDVLLDEKILGLNARSMKESRALTQRMYKALSKD